MSGSLIPNAKQQFLDANGNPLAGGFVYYYIPSTTTFKNTYQNAALTILNTNPIILDSAGECMAYGNGSYRQIVTDVNGNLIWDQPTVSCATTDYVDSAIAAATTNGNFVTLTVGGTQLGAGDSSSLKNRIINGAMRIDQRNAGASVTPTNIQYILDRYFAGLTQASKFTVQQNAGSVTPPVGFTKYLGITSTSAYSVLTNDYFSIEQKIEGFNIADLAWGTANAKSVTLSFQVYSSLTGTFGGAIRNASGNYTYPFSYTVSTANTWTSISVTIAGPTAGTWLTNNGTGMYVTLGLGVGSTFSGTAGAWSGGNYLSAASAVSVVGTSGATFYITGLQLEVGLKATGFDYRQYGTELFLCQRYFEKSYKGDIAVGSSGQTYAGDWTGISNSAADFYTWRNGVIPFQVTKRIIPTMILWSPNGVQGQFYRYDTSANQGNSGVSGTTDKVFGLYCTNDAFTVGGVYGSHWSASAEL
jgi:hypothetical protein